MKETRTIQKVATAAGVLATLALGAGAHAQSSDALIDKLVEKGILTVREANDLREEADKGFNQAYQVKSGMPDWVTSMKFNGDLRGRYEGIYTGVNDIPDRSRFRYRLRFGFVASLMDDFEIGFRLASGGTDDPISTNQTLGRNAAKKPIAIDLAYAKWSPLNTATFTGTFIGGKMENPFVFSDMVFDGDYTPEGLAQQFGYVLNEKQALKLTLGEYILDELGATSEDPYMGIAQLRWDAAWSQKVQTSVGVAGLAISGAKSLGTDNGQLPNVGRGNTRTPFAAGAGGDLVYNYNPIVVDGAVTYLLDSFPMYKGFFPVRFGADYMHNPAADDDNQAYSVGVVFGKAGKKGLWEIGYRWKELQADAWYEEVVDSDFGAVYAVAPFGGSTGYQSGTNVRGHIIKAAYSPYDSLTLGLTCFLTELINESPAGAESSAQRLQLDAVWKF